MRKIYLSLLFSCFLALVFGQEKDTINIDQGVRFVVVENAPTLPGCETLRQDLQKLCLQNQIKKLVARNFDMSITDSLNLTPGQQRIYVQFPITKDGDITQIRARGTRKRLEQEGMRVVSLLPKMIPGKHRGKNVNVKYTLPITFLVEGTSKIKSN